MLRNKFIRVIGIVMMISLLISMLSISAFAYNFTDEQIAFIQENVKINGSKLEFNGRAASLKSWLSLDVNSKLKSEDRAIITNVTDESGSVKKPVYLAKQTMSELSDQIDMLIRQGNIDGKEIIGPGYQADTKSAMQMLEGFKPIFQLILGIITVLIMIGMTLYSAFDLAYIAFPVFRNSCETAKASGGAGGGFGKAMTTTGKGGETKLRFVSDDAQLAVAESATSEGGKSPWFPYFKRRVVSYVFLAIVMFIFLTGNITLIADIALNVVAGIMDVFIGLAA